MILYDSMSNIVHQLNGSQIIHASLSARPANSLHGLMVQEDSGSAGGARAGTRAVVARAAMGPGSGSSTPDQRETLGIV